MYDAPRKGSKLDGNGMEIQKRVLSDGAVRWRVRWRQGNRYRARTFDRKGDAVTLIAHASSRACK